MKDDMKQVHETLYKLGTDISVGKWSDGPAWAVLEYVTDFVKGDLENLIDLTWELTQEAEIKENEIEKLKAELEEKEEEIHRLNNEIQDMKDYTEPCPHCRVAGCICP